MLEKALISGVTHTREEAIYRVDGIDAPPSSSPRSPTRAVNVDTIVQTGAEIVFSAPIADRADATRSARRPRRRSGRARRPGQGQPRRRRDEEPSGCRRQDVRDARRSSGSRRRSCSTSPIKIACFVALDDVERGRPGAARGVRAATPSAAERAASPA